MLGSICRSSPPRCAPQQSSTGRQSSPNMASERNQYPIWGFGKQQPTTFVAIDIAKFRHEVMIEPPGRKRYRLTILNERAKHDRLIDHLRSCPAPVAVCFEPTGDYHRAIAWRLVDAGVDVSLISSVALARMREAIHNSWDKNDPKDAQVMLHMIKSGNVMRYVDPLAADEWAAGRTRPLRDGGLGRLDKLRCLSP